MYFSHADNIIYRHFSPDALLHLISSETAMTIFPTEAIGQIADGFRADFLVFDQHPVQADSVLKPENVFIEGKLKK